jgi:hypothetical protein
VKAGGTVGIASGIAHRAAAVQRSRFVMPSTDYVEMLAIGAIAISMVLTAYLIIFSAYLFTSL